MLFSFCKNADAISNKLFSIFLCIAFVCCLFFGCDNNAASEKDKSSTFPQTVSEDLIIHTEYGDLHYPDQWREYVKTHQKKSKGTVEITFEAKIEKSYYKLFEILIGGDNGEIIGKLTDNNGIQRNVYLCVAELPVNSGLDEAEQNRFYAMQEDLNYLIDNLK